MPERLAVLVFVGAVTLPFVVVTLLVSAIRRTPFENGARALGWLIVVFIATAAAASAFEPGIALVAAYVGGAVVTYALATRDGYRFDALSWLLLFLSFLGYWIILWRREETLWRRARPKSAATRPS